MNINITFANGKTYPARGVCERQLYLQGDTVKWALDFHIKGAFSSDDVSTLLQENNIGTLTLSSEASKDSILLSGYNKVERAIIQYNDLIDPYVEVRLTKNEKTVEVTDDGESGTV